MLNAFKKPITHKKILIYSAFISILILGVYFRLKGIISRNLEYDEIWTLSNYSSKSLHIIFTELATPNNHPLNSLLIKISTAFFGVNNLAIRFPVLLAGFLLMIFTALLSERIFHNKVIAFLVLILVSFNGALVHYSQTARGYEIQTFIIVLYAYFLIYLETSERNKFSVMFFGLFLLPILSVLILPTSVLFIIPITALYLIKFFRVWRNREKLNFRCMIVDLVSNKKFVLIILSYIAIVSWLLLNYNQFKAAQSFGNSIDSLNSFWFFFRRLTYNVVLIPLFLLTFFGLFLKRTRFVCFGALLIYIFILFTAVLFKSGPNRVYLPLIPVFIVSSCGSFFYYMKILVNNKKILSFVVVAVSLLWVSNVFPKQLKKWTPPDFKKIYNVLCKNLPKNYYISFPAGDGLPASYKNMYSITQNYIRLPSYKTQYIAVYETKGFIEGINIKGNIGKIVLSDSYKIFKHKGNKLFVYKLKQLKKIDGDINKKIIFASFPLNLKSSVDLVKYNLIKNLRYNKVIILNSWFRYPVTSKDNKVLSGALLVFTGLDLKAKHLEYIQKKTKNIVKFYYLNRK
ncbi:MAG: glycosyltransferase family 39 protein [Victivallales bacterium]|nr:glycosyltransferase family 39 protein [Victivallales bacterium]